MKLQLLPDIVEDIRRHGPAIRFSTEVFECFNAIFRLCSVLSNHQAPSRDIARKFISMDRVKHMLSGGYWRERETWVQAGENVRSLLRTEPFIQRHLGWVPPKDPKYGKYGIESRDCTEGFLETMQVTSLQSQPKSLNPAYGWKRMHLLVERIL
jgi:hypothetical protein